MIKSSVLAFIVGLAAVAANADGGDTFTLDDGLAVAYETNPRLQAARADVRAADERVAEANAGWRPHIEASGSYGIEKTKVYLPPPSFDLNNHPLNGAVNVTQPVFEGSIIPRIRQAKALVRASREQLIATEETVLFDALTAYLDVVRDMQVYQYNQDNVDVLRRQVQATRDQLRFGAVTRTDLSESQSRLAAAERGLSASLSQLAQSRNAFTHAIGRAPENLDLQLKPPAIPDDEAAAAEAAVRHNPTLRQAVEQERAADFGVSSALGQLLPKLSITTGYQYDRDRYGLAGPHSTEAGLTISGRVTVPIYDGGASIAATREANNIHDRAQFDVVDAERSVRQSVSDSWQQLNAASGAVGSSRAQVAASKSAVEGVRAEQQAGERQILDILNAQQELLQAQVALVSAERDFIISHYRILVTMGALTARDLQLKVKLYDPTDHYDSTAGLLNFGG